MQVTKTLHEIVKSLRPDPGNFMNVVKYYEPQLFVSQFFDEAVKVFVEPATLIDIFTIKFYESYELIIVMAEFTYSLFTKEFFSFFYCVPVTYIFIVMIP